MILFLYIDPGSTALTWQILAGVLIVFGVVLGIWWTKITTFFKGIFAKLFGKKGSDTQRDEALEEILDDENNNSNNSNNSSDSNNSDDSDVNSEANS